MQTSNSKPPPVVRVLIVEDSLDDRDLLIRQLRKTKTDHHVKFIADGKMALDYLLYLPPAVPFPAI